MKAVFVLGLIALASATPIDVEKPLDGVPLEKVNPGRIVGGVEATQHEFPYIVDMRRSGSHYCAGTIISPEWVVTAAHCSEGTISSYSLVAGDHNIVTPDAETEQTRQVVQIIKHPSYDSPLQFQNDIALMKVDPPFEFNQYIQPANVTTNGFTPTPVATVTGWGALTEGGGSPSVLMKVDVPYVDDATCNVAYSGGIADSMICYGEAGKDSCQGDSGGPILCGPENARQLCGIVSWGRGCAREGYPGVYTETSYYDEWIRTATTPTEEDPEPITTVSGCGGFVETSSGTIEYSIGENAPRGQKCVWTVKTPYDSMRMRLTQSGLTDGDGLFVTRFNGQEGTPGSQVQITEVDTDYVQAGGLVLITLAIHDTPGHPARGFRLQFFSSGFGDSSPALSGYASLNATSGTFSYPTSGQYMNSESGLFVLSPEEAGDKTLTFSRLDVENDSMCRYDAVAVYSWENNMYTLQSRFCGSSLPSPFLLPGGAGIVTFVTDSSVTATGFSFDWA